MSNRAFSLGFHYCCALRYAAITDAGTLPRSLILSPVWRAQERTSALLGAPTDPTPDGFRDLPEPLSVTPARVRGLRPGRPFFWVRGIAYQQAQAVLEALALRDGVQATALRVEGSEAVVDVEVLDHRRSCWQASSSRSGRSSTRGGMPSSSR